MVKFVTKPYRLNALSFINWVEQFKMKYGVLKYVGYSKLKLELAIAL